MHASLAFARWPLAQLVSLEIICCRLLIRTRASERASVCVGMCCVSDECIEFNLLRVGEIKKAKRMQKKNEPKKRKTKTKTKNRWQQWHCLRATHTNTNTITLSMLTAQSASRFVAPHRAQILLNSESNKWLLCQLICGSKVGHNDTSSFVVISQFAVDLIAS